MCNSRNKIYYKFCYYPLMYLISMHDFTYVPIYFGLPIWPDTNGESLDPFIWRELSCQGDVTRFGHLPCCYYM